MTEALTTEAAVVAEAPAAEPTAAAPGKPQVSATEAKILIHVSFNPDASVRSIGEKPATVSEDEWFKRLNDKAGDAYQGLAGGRGVFRLDRGRLEALKAAALH